MWFHLSRHTFWHLSDVLEDVAINYLMNCCLVDTFCCWQPFERGWSPCDWTMGHRYNAWYDTSVHDDDEKIRLLSCFLTYCTQSRCFKNWAMRIRTASFLIYFPYVQERLPRFFVVEAETALYHRTIIRSLRGWFCYLILDQPALPFTLLLRFVFRLQSPCARRNLVSALGACVSLPLERP